MVGKQYPRVPFSQNSAEAATLYGFRVGTLNVEKREHRYRAEIITGHPGELRMFCALLSKYVGGHIIFYPIRRKKTNTYSFKVVADLDESFTFLFKKPTAIPEYIMVGPEDLFMRFFGAFSDVVGQWILSEADGGFNMSYRIKSTSLEVIKGIHSKLRQKGFAPQDIRVEKASGAVSLHGLRQKNYYVLEMGGKGDVVRLAKMLRPMSLNPEQTDKMNLVVYTERETRWSGVTGAVDVTRAAITSSTNQCRRDAEECYWAKKEGNAARLQRVKEKYISP